MSIVVGRIDAFPPRHPITRYPIVDKTDGGSMKRVGCLIVVAVLWAACPAQAQSVVEARAKGTFEISVDIVRQP